jgi:predicted flap endonuclease-1-like 5' DNA nuclease
MGYTDGLIAGVIIGWLVEWVMDWFFWRRRGRLWGKVPVEMTAQAASQRLTELERELESYKAKLAVAEQTISRLQSEANRAASQRTQPADRLERIRGINADYGGQLREAGIQTFDQLASMTPDQIEGIVQPKGRRPIESKKWISEAKGFVKEAARKEKGARR